MPKKISNFFLKSYLRKYASTLTRGFSDRKYYLQEHLENQGEKILENYQKGNLILKKSQFKNWARFIDTFGTYNREELLDDLQQKINTQKRPFNVREFLQRDKLTLWQKLTFSKGQTVARMSPLELKFKAWYHVRCCKMYNHRHFMHYTDMAVLKRHEEAEQYAKALINHEFDIKPKELIPLKKYFYTICYPLSSYPEAQQALTIVKNKEKELKISDHKKEYRQDKKSWSLTGFMKKAKSKLSQIGNKLKTVAAVTVVGLAGLFGLKTCQNTTPNHIAKAPTATIHKAIKTDSIATPQTPIASQQKEKGTADFTSEAQKVWKNYYMNAIEMLTSAQERDKLCQQINQQLAQGTFSLPQDISPERLAYAQVMYKQYGIKSSLQSSINSQTKLTAEQQAQLVQDVYAAGKQGKGVQAMAQKQHQGKLSSYSKYDEASFQQQKKHVKNLQQLRQLRAKYGLQI